MRTRSSVGQELQPREIDRFLTGLAATETFREAYPDIRSPWQRLFGSPRFTWQTGWLTVDRAATVFVHMSGWPPGLLTEAHARLAAVFNVVRAETGLLDRRRHHPFRVILISGRRS